MKKLFGFVLALVAFLSVTGVAQAYEGDWAYDNNQGGSEILLLEDNSTGATRVLRGSGWYCGTPGASYATMRSTILANGDSQIIWWEDQICSDNHVRICVQNKYSKTRCSTYYDAGWR